VIELGVVYNLSEFGFFFIIAIVHIPIPFLGHPELLLNFRRSLLLISRYFLIPLKALGGAAVHKLSEQLVSVKKGSFVSCKLAIRGAVVAHAELIMERVIRPVEFYEHVVLAHFKVLILFPRVAHIAHLSILVSDHFNVFFGVLDLHDNQADI